MPFVKVLTNLSRNQLPVNFMPNFSRHLAGVLNKTPDSMKWILETDKSMAMGCELDGPSKNFFLVEIESIAVFKTPEDCSKHVPKIFDYITTETSIQKSEIATKFRDLEAFHVGADGMTMAEKLAGK